MTSPSKTSFRDIFLLSVCQALLLMNTSAVMAMSGLIGYSLVDNKRLATVALTTYVIGSALSALPAALWMSKVGRRKGFMAGASVAMIGIVLCAIAVSVKNFPLYCLGTAILGVYMAFGIQYRFAAAEVATLADKPKAISLVLAGGVVGGFLGPAVTNWAKDALDVPFLGAFLALIVFAACAITIQSCLKVPGMATVDLTAGRPTRQIVRQPVFIVAAMAAALGYGTMNLLMAATPLAMSFCGHGYSSIATVFQWHIVAMYAPGFFTGHIIQRLGSVKVISIGVVLMMACVAVALLGNQFVHFWVALAFLGLGWNLMYTGATTLLTEAYRPVEKAKIQGLNDLIVFSVMGVSSFSSGVLVNAAGWEIMNVGALPFLLAVGGSLIWFVFKKRSMAALPG